jgi:UDP-glucose:glycoprotein glucosyltransferase
VSRSPQDLPFDRILGNASAPASILYADITSPTFGQFHETLIRTAREGKTSYRLRHRKPLSLTTTPLEISGYGVELALKRTDYIVIDDRNEEDVEANKAESKQEVILDDEELADLKPLSTSELLSLSLKASSFVMQSENPFETLIKLSQDFPKYSTAMAAHNASKEFLAEHSENRGMFVPSGMNIMWINGVQIVERQLDAFTLLDILRREKRLIDSVRELSLTGPEAIKLLSHSAVAVAKSEDEPQRFDWTDAAEGGNVIIWLNDIEKDKRYEAWPADLKIVSRTSQDVVGIVDQATATTENFPGAAPIRS